MKKDKRGRFPLLISLVAVASVLAVLIGDRIARLRRKPRPPKPPFVPSAAPEAPEVEWPVAERPDRRAAALGEEAIPAEVPLPPEQVPAPPSPPRTPWPVVALSLMLAATLPVMVILDRWLGVPEIEGLAHEAWCRIDFLCQLGLPSYFAIGLPAVVAAVVLLLVARPSPLLGNGRPAQLPAGSPRTPLTEKARKLGRNLQLVAGVGVLGVAVAGFGWRRVPGWDYVLVLGVYVAGLCLEEVPAGRWAFAVRHHGPRVGSIVSAQVGLALFLAAVHTSRPILIAPALILEVPLAYRLSRGERLSPAFWLVSVATLLFSYRLNSWLYSVIGDEYSFFTQARSILTEHGLLGTGARLFMGRAVYGAHPYFASVIQAAFMALLGIGNFGWRFSNAYLTALSAGLFFLFWRGFLPRRAALTASILLATSHYLINFSKIGYDNLQALFAAALVLWVAGVALRSGNPVAFSCLGLAMGVCLYVYPAALYALPIPVLLLLIFWPPRSRDALRGWWRTTAAFSLMLLPLLFQPDYWTAKVAGTIFNNPSLLASAGSALQHLGSNLVYSLMSYAYSPEESHFLVVSYLDPLSAIFVPIGFALILRQFRSNRLWRFVALAFLVELVLVGVTHDRRLPTATRMFMLLPWWTLFASLGLLWALDQVAWFRSRSWPVVLAIAAIIGTNVVQAFVVFRHRTEGRASLEVLFLRMVQKDSGKDSSGAELYLFLTEPDWGIDGIRLLRDVYGVPASQEALDRVVVEGAWLEPQVAGRIQQEDTVVIIQPWMEPEVREAVEASLKELGKVECPVSDTATTPPRFSLWLSPSLSTLCTRANLPW